eukprot:3649763-Pyramimonas_sp.AAC.1
MTSLMTLATRVFRLVLTTTPTLMRVTLRRGLAALETAVVGQGLVETLLMTPVTWEITLVLLAMAVARDGRCTIETPRNTTDDPTRVQSVGGGGNANTGNVEG